jgi:acetyl esterase/lipase
MSVLAGDQAVRGAAVVVISYRTSDSEAFFPVPVEDVACGLGYAVHAMDGLDVSEVVLAGHSSGAHMAAMVALAPEDFVSPECPTSPSQPTR